MSSTRTGSSPTTQPTSPASAGSASAGPLLAHPWLRVGLAIATVAWGGNEFTPLLNLYRTVDHLSATVVFVLLGVYVLGIIPALLIGGPLSDRHGRRPVMLAAPFIAAAGSLVLALGTLGPEALFVGRILSGIALGLAMGVGTSWIKELSQSPHDPSAAPGAGARRAGLSMTAGFALGAAVAAVLAQWGPWPTTLPYCIDIVLALAAGLWQLPTPETAGPGHAPVPRRLRDALRVPAAGERRFLLVVVPTAAWVFGTNGIAYATLPGLLLQQTAAAPIAFSGLMCLVTLGCGFVAQQFAWRVQKERSSRGLRVAMLMAICGLGLALAATATLSLVLSIIAAAVLGVSYGFLLQGGLREVQSIARADDLAGLTGVYYSIAYLGFFLPMLLSLASGWVGYPWLLGALVVLAVAELVVVSCAGRLHPQRRFGTTPREENADSVARACRAHRTSGSGSPISRR